MSDKPNLVLVATLLDDIRESIEWALKEARYTQMWDESIPIEAWLDDINTALKELGVNL